MIRGKFTSYAGPAITCSVSLPGLGTGTAEVTFLLDTGASFSILHPGDVASLRVDSSLLSGLRTTTGRGIGGGASYVAVDGRLSIRHLDGNPVTYWLPLHLTERSEVNADYPSVLGMDFISYFKMCVSLNDTLVELT